ncbi:MAG: hypothetical protein Q8R25_00535 [bacterium]|nr:hypothetical protein [bacterium]
MQKQIAETQNWIRRVQRSSDRTKRVWLIILSVSFMGLIISVWFLYLNFTLPKLKGASREEKPEKEQFWKVFGEGFSVIGEGAWREVRNAEEKFKGLKEAAENKIKFLE